MDSLSAVKVFKERYKLRDGMFFAAIVDVETILGEFRCADSCECNVIYSTGYGQYEINIMWPYNDKQLKNLGIKKMYNTNFHSIHFQNDCLIIQDEKTKIFIKQDDEESP